MARWWPESTRCACALLLAALASCSPTSGGDASVRPTDGSVATDRGVVDGEASPPGDGSAIEPRDGGSECDLECGAHGVCLLEAANAVCRCDDGWSGAHCEDRAPEAFDRVLVALDLADPAALVLEDGRVIVSGTRGGRTLPLLESSDLRSFDSIGDYDPQRNDPGHDYCHVWAPDLSRTDEAFHLYFSAQRVSRGSPCPSGAQDVATYHSEGASLATLGPPEPIHPGTAFPRTYAPRGCPPEGCRHAIRIDSTLSDGWFHYVWFSGGNNISAFRWADPTRVIDVAGPATRFGHLVSAEEEAINEAPELFERRGMNYLFFSTGWFDGQYAMKLVTAPSIEELHRGRATRRISTPVRDRAGNLLESHGHNTVIAMGEEYFNVFHQGAFERGALIRRDTYLQRMSFHPDGTPQSLNFVDVRWGALEGHRYSLDVRLRDGTIFGPCIAVGRIGERATVRFGGVCPDRDDARVEKSKIAAFRIYYTDDGDFREFAEAAYDGHSDDVFVAIAGARPTVIPVRWNERETAAEYSLDVQRRDGTWIAPCVGAAFLGRALEHDFSGDCRSAGVRVPLEDIATVRVCSAEGGDWARASCGRRAWHDGLARLDVEVP